MKVNLKLMKLIQKNNEKFGLVQPFVNIKEAEAIHYTTYKTYGKIRY